MGSGINRQNQPETRRTDQAVLNRGFDEDFQVIAVEGLGFGGNSLHRQRADDVVVLYDQVGGYIGYAEPGSLTSDPVWQIKRIDTSAGLVMTYAAGNANYDKIWDNRAALAYS